MPELFFSVRWPDQSVTECYSPSTVVKDYLCAGQSYPIQQFVALSRDALTLASERVRARYGYACSSARDQLFAIEHRAQKFSNVDDACVVVEKFRQPSA